MKFKSFAGFVIAAIASVSLSAPAVAGQPEVHSAVRGTPVTRIRAMGDINLRTGPGTGYRRVGKLYYGDVARVTGASDRYGWWRVVCPWGGACWISANPYHTRPIAWR